MAISGGNRGYNTYILGTARSIIDCLSIIVYNRSELRESDRVEKINIYNIDRVIKALVNSGNYSLLRKTTPEAPFNFLSDSLNNTGFNTIIYLSNSDDSVGVGYTEFVSIQGKYRDTSIFINFTSEVDCSTSITISNSLSQLLQSNSTSSKEFSGDENGWEYTTPKKIIESIGGYKLPTLFSAHVSSLSSRDNSNIWTDNSIVLGKDSSLHSLGIIKNIPIDLYQNEFQNTQIGYWYDNDIAYYSWEGMKYSIYSLCKVNRFGNPQNYTPGPYSQNYFTIPSRRATDYIMYFSGRYAVVLSGGETRYYDIVEKEWVNSPSLSTNIFLDSLDPTSRFQEYPTGTYNSIISVLPELVDINFDLRKFGNNNFINILGKHGSWYIISQIISQKSNKIYIISNHRMTLKISSAEFSNMSFLSDNAILLKTYEIGEDGVERISLECYSNPGEYESLEARKLLYSTEQRKKLEITYQNFYSRGVINKLGPEDFLWSGWFGGFKRNYTPLTLEVYPTPKNFVGAFAGIIFYKTQDNYLNYL